MVRTAFVLHHINNYVGRSSLWGNVRGFGVFMSEIADLHTEPFKIMSNAQAIKYVEAGNRLEQPKR